ncbi:hypothetical protein RA280_20115 [Cupriavidus sp. CV2]|uniref:phage late control D family protein n=1 Tax=Cupriavidus ulmosensis TaxID=3065913 RepID=UPI00296B397B|nr:hypothetical protein [Cupriavidus sp. CV2]MDW3684009.1 hypothetical protein [Cupriavidus sp. CV2]
MNKATGSVAAVRGVVKVNGERITGWSSFEVENNSYSSADTFSCTFAANALPADRNVAWFSQQEDMEVELFAGVPSNPNQYTAEDLKSLICGHADQPSYDPAGGTISVSGRDLTRLFIEAKTTEKFQNKTSSQVATILAARHGLAAQVTKTTTPIGKYYEIDHEHMHDARTEWDVLTQLARLEQYVVRVRGKTLFFEPKPDPATATPYQIIWTPPDPHTGFSTCNVTGLKLDRALTVSRGIIVTVRSWNDAAGKAFSATYPPTSQTKAQPGSVSTSAQEQTYRYSIPNLDQRQVEQHARVKYAEIIQHEMSMSFEVPAAGNDALDVTSIVQLKGTGTAWDQTYFPDSLRRRLSIGGGYQLSVSAKNHAPDSQVTGV